MRVLVVIAALILTSPLLANPYAGMSHADIRRAIAEIAPVFKENWYQIEILAFARQRPANDEYWRLDQHPDLNYDALIKLDSEEPVIPSHADQIDQQALAYGAWRRLDTTGLPLAGMAEKMAKAGDRILLHSAWRQPVRERGRAFPVLIEGGNALPAQEATVTAVDTLQDLAAQAAVVDSQGHFTSLPDIEPVAIEEPAVIRELQGVLRFHLSRYLHVEPQLWFGNDITPEQRVWVKIDQNRRMRSEELHYLDHPLFGLLVRITPWKHPEQKKLDELNALLPQ